MKYYIDIQGYIAKIKLKFIIIFDAILYDELTTTPSVASFIWAELVAVRGTDGGASTTLGDVAASGFVTFLKASS